MDVKALLKNKKALQIGGIAGGIILVIVIVAIAMSGRTKKINIEEYVDITYSGVNGYAKANVTLDKNGIYLAILEANGKKVDYDDIDSMDALASALQDDVEINECIDQIELSVSQESNLSNGDIITVEISYDNDLAKKQKVKFTGSSSTLRVKNLEDAIPIDPFEGLEVSFTGTSPAGKVKYSYNGSDPNVSRNSFSAEPSSNLKNGDIVTITYNFNELELQKAGYAVINSQKEYEVSGLADAVPVDPFEGLEVSFTGISPKGSLNFSYNGSDPHVSRYSFSAEPSSNLKNGDIVTITYNFNELEAQNAGYVITNTQMEYEVSGLDEYIQAYADLPQDFLDKMKSDANDKIRAYSASNYYSSGSNLSDLSYDGYIMRSPKEGSSNQLYLIYSGNVSSTSGAFPAAKVYYPVMFKDIMKKDGELSYDMGNIQGSSNLGGRNNTNGYINPVLCYVDLVEKSLDSYNCECGDGFEVFEEFEHVKQLSDIGDSYKQVLYQDARDTIESYIAKSYNNGSTASGLTLVGEYLLVAKNLGYLFESNNTYIVVYSAEVSNENDFFEPKTVYYPVLYKGIVHLPNGEYMLTQSGGLQGESLLGGKNYWSSYYTSGYTDGQAMFNDLVLRQVENYTYEVSEGLKQFGQ